MTSLSLKPASVEQLSKTRGGRGHGEYDQTVIEFYGMDEYGVEVEFADIKPDSVKASLKNALKRAIEAETIPKDTVEVRGFDNAVYLVRSDLAPTDES